MAKSKNINMAPRQSHGGTTVDGVTMRVMDNSDSGATFKIKKSK